MGPNTTQRPKKRSSMISLGFMISMLTLKLARGMNIFWCGQKSGCSGLVNNWEVKKEMKIQQWPISPPILKVYLWILLTSTEALMHTQKSNGKWHWIGQNAFWKISIPWLLLLFHVLRIYLIYLMTFQRIKKINFCGGNIWEKFKIELFYLPKIFAQCVCIWGICGRVDEGDYFR